MKDYHFQIAGMKELAPSEQQEVSGGIGLALLAAIGGLYGVYNLGKAIGTELRYQFTH